MKTDSLFLCSCYIHFKSITFSLQCQIFTFCSDCSLGFSNRQVHPCRLVEVVQEENRCFMEGCHISLSCLSIRLLCRLTWTMSFLFLNKITFSSFWCVWILCGMLLWYVICGMFPIWKLIGEEITFSQAHLQFAV